MLSKRLLLLAYIANLAPVQAYKHHAFNPAKDLEAGSFATIEGFYNYLGTNSSDWEEKKVEARSRNEAGQPVTSRSEPGHGLERFSEAPGFNPLARDERGLLSKRDDESWCSDLRNDVMHDICVFLPYKWPALAVGATGAASYFILRTPESREWTWGIIAETTRYVWNSEFVRRRFRKTDEGQHPIELMGLRETEMPEFIHFRVEEYPKGKIQARDLLEDGSTREVHYYKDYMYDTANGVIEDQGIDVTMSGINTPDKHSAKRQDTAPGFTFTLTARRIMEFFPTSQLSCIETWLNQALVDMDVEGSHVCRPLDEPDQYFQGEGYMIGMHINEGSTNWDYPFTCCL